MTPLSYEGHFAINPKGCDRPSHVLSSIKYRDWGFYLAPDDSYLQVVFDDPDTGEVQRGRKWRLSKFMTRSEIAQTAFMAVLAAEEHEIREKFLYRGKAVFGPHFSIDALHSLCESGELDARQHTEPV